MFCTKATFSPANCCRLFQLRCDIWTKLTESIMLIIKSTVCLHLLFLNGAIITHKLRRHKLTVDIESFTFRLLETMVNQILSTVMIEIKRPEFIYISKIKRDICREILIFLSNKYSQWIRENICSPAPIWYCYPRNKWKISITFLYVFRLQIQK